MKCIYCNKEIDEGSIFCGYCGKKQPEVKHCVKCGQEIGLDDAFCGYCGASQNVKPLGAVEEIEEHLLPSQIREEKETDEVLPLKEPIVTNDVYDSKHEVIETNEEEQLPSLNVNEEFSREQKSHEINSESNDIESEEVVNEDKFQSGSDLGVVENNYKPIKIICIIAVLLAVAVLIVYLTNPNISTGSENNTYVACDSTEEDMLTARIEYIFNEVYENGKDGDSCFLTSEYKSLLRKEREVTPDGELGCFDIDRWWQAQDCENLSMTVHSVEISDLKAKAKITITNFGHNFDIEIVLIKERGDWYIDDFINSLGSEKKALKDYIASAQDNNYQEAINFLEEFYAGFSLYDDNYIRKHITNNAKRVLNDKYGYDCDGDCLATWLFDTGGECDSKSIRTITSQGSNKYLVENKLSCGTYSVLLTLVRDGKSFKIDNIEPLKFVNEFGTYDYESQKHSIESEDKTSEVR